MIRIISPCQTWKLLFVVDFGIFVPFALYRSLNAFSNQENSQRSSQAGIGYRAKTRSQQIFAT